MDATNAHHSIIEGRSLILDCLVTGTPKPVITWSKVIYFYMVYIFLRIYFKDGKPLENNELAFTVNENQQLYIEEVEKRHAGRYSCIAENIPGRAEKDIVVSLLSTL